SAPGSCSSSVESRGRLRRGGAETGLGGWKRRPKLGALEPAPLSAVSSLSPVSFASSVGLVGSVSAAGGTAAVSSVVVSSTGFSCSGAIRHLQRRRPCPTPTPPRGATRPLARRSRAHPARGSKSVLPRDGSRPARHPHGADG